MEGKITSKFSEKPSSPTAWWAMGLGLGTLLIWPVLGIFGAVLAPILDKGRGQAAGIFSGFVLAILSLTLSISALVMGMRAIRKGERSWALWIGFVPAILVGAFWVFMVVGEFVVPH